MRHFVLLFLAALAAYGLWQLGGRHSLHRVARHGIRLAAIGPLQVNDLGGLEIVTHVYNNLVPELRSDAEIPPVVQNLVDGGHVGVKTGQGFYHYPADTIKATTAARDARLLDLLKLFYDWKKTKASE